MTLQERLDALNDIDLNDIDLSRIGDWPTSVKAILVTFLFILVIVLGYFFWLQPKLDTLDSSVNKESDLKRQYEQKSHKSANLEAYKAQNKWLKESFAKLLQQLPTDTEIPGLIDDITKVGVDGGLRIEQIKIGKESEKEYFIEQPMNITLTGSYHNFGAFVSGVATLSRIVTLHDFSAKRAGNSDEELDIQILAKTYRYKEVSQ